MFKRKYRERVIEDNGRFYPVVRGRLWGWNYLVRNNTRRSHIDLGGIIGSPNNSGKNHRFPAPEIISCKTLQEAIGHSRRFYQEDVWWVSRGPSYRGPGLKPNKDPVIFSRGENLVLVAPNTFPATYIDCKRDPVDKIDTVFKVADYMDERQFADYEKLLKKRGHCFMSLPASSAVFYPRLAGGGMLGFFDEKGQMMHCRIIGKDDEY